jgi:L-fuculose-phosphate aldolase
MSNLRSAVIKYSKKLNSTNLSPLRSGNISVRAKEENIDGFYITPSGAKYSSLRPKDISFVSLKGKFDKEKSIPSSEWRFHQDIYKNKIEAKAIVHAHSNCATAISAHGKGIPAFHYMVAMAGGKDIKCAKYATYGTRELSRNILKALKYRSACLIGNHGQIAFSDNLSKAFELAEEVENLSNQYIKALKIGKPKILSSKEMNKVLSKAKNYKKG